MPGEEDYIIELLEKEVKSLPVRRNECLQHLTELGYIALEKLNALFPGDLEKAKQEFLKEAAASGLFTEAEMRPEIFQDEEDFLADLLGKTVDIDDGFAFSKLPQAGELSLQSRIIHYRLDIFGLWPFPVGTKFSVINSKAALDKLADFTGFPALESLNLMADLDGLTLALLKARGEEDFILAFKSSVDDNSELARKLDRRGMFKRQLIKDFGERTDFFKYLNKHILKENDNKVDINFLQNESNDPFKQFILRLIQVHQWHDGFYNGLLDSDIGEVTLNSITDAIDIYNQADLSDIKTFRVLTYICDGYFLFNALFFLNKYMLSSNVPGGTQDAEEGILSDLLGNIQNSDEDTLASFQENLEKLKLQIAEESGTAPQERKGFLQRVYFGIGRFFKKLARFTRKIFGWIVRFVKLFGGLLKKIFSHFFRKLSQGIQAFLDGIKFMFGRKGTISQDEKGTVVSLIRADGDAFSIVAGEGQTLIRGHIQKIKYGVSSMAFALAIVGGVLRAIIKVVSVITWPLLVFTIINIVKQISEAYKKIEIINT